MNIISQFCRSPVGESSDGRLCFFELLFGLDSSVEDWAVTTLAQNFLMQGSLAALALNPQVTVLLFVELKLVLSLNVDFLHFELTVLADDFLGTSKEIFAAKASLLHFGKLEQTHV